MLRNRAAHPYISSGTSSSSAGLSTCAPVTFDASSRPALSARGSGRDDALILIRCHHRCTTETIDYKLLVPISRTGTQGVRGAALASQLIEAGARSEEHTSELQSRQYLVCRLLLEKKT